MAITAFPIPTQVLYQTAIADPSVSATVVGERYLRTDTLDEWVAITVGSGAADWVQTTAGGLDGTTLAIGLTFPNAGLKILDTPTGDHSLTIQYNEEATANRTLALILGDSNRTIDLSSPTTNDILNWDGSKVAWATPLDLSALPSDFTIAGDDGASRTLTLGQSVTNPDAVIIGGGSFQLPVATNPTLDSNGEIALDSSEADWSHGLIKYYGGEILGVVAMPVAQFASPTDNYVVTYNAANDEFELQPGGAGGPVTSGLDNQLLTDDGSGGITSEANATFNGTTFALSGSTAVFTNTQGQTDSEVFGDGSLATNTQVTCVGKSVTGSGLRGTAIGYLSTCGNTNTGAIGYLSNATGSNSFAMGAIAQATATGSLSIGTSSSCSATDGISIGRSTSMTGSYSIAIGNLATTGAFTNCVAIGRGATATANDQIIFQTGGGYRTAYFGRGVSNAAPPATMDFYTTSTATGTSNIAAMSMRLFCGASTGSGTPADISFHTTLTTGTATDQQTHVQTLRLNRTNVVVGNAAIATSATDGFLYLPTCAGAPSGTPTTYTGRAAAVYDSTNHRIYIYSGSWRSVAVA